ncbi:MAG: hypothetical protein UY44_C0001G0015 [Candidatus Kaiserbacteria bacterium GW2011_GWA2_49_19]|uniref:Uncharacterized protein n=1 Tax=Candidatus Kaiserbacteria bacterium GW2011_GWA2_49_19 TaxID=1618669 RepID=A0A0G1VT31_9BACT|nr:MAG: hypothetical protein UY44_C0001G0015 [Candidatus Kaiserbacteria bacterium GW2011_GWA2_49_19]
MKNSFADPLKQFHFPNHLLTFYVRAADPFRELSSLKYPFKLKKV